MEKESKKRQTYGIAGDQPMVQLVPHQRISHILLHPDAWLHGCIRV